VRTPFIGFVVFLIVWAMMTVLGIAVWRFAAWEWGEPLHWVDRFVILVSGFASAAAVIATRNPPGRP
jgi:hypothetical protein